MKNCPRCGNPVKGTGWTGYCQPCSVALAAKKTKAGHKVMEEGTQALRGRRGRGRSRKRPVTLASVK